MNRKLFSLVLVALSFVTLHSAAAAQSNLHLRANIPFGFTLENQAFAAGAYEITQLEPSVLTLRNVADGKSVVIRVSEGRSEVPASGNPAIVFHRYGERYFLAQVSRAQSSHAMAVPAGNQEQEQARAKAPRDLIAVGPTASQAGNK